MQLEYSFNDIPPLFCAGNLPFGEMRTEKVKVSMSGKATGPFPPVASIGDLLCHRRPQTNEIGITLLLRYQAGVTPPSNEPISLEDWIPVPNSPIYGQIRVALTQDAIDTIRKMSGEGYEYELLLDDVQLIDKTQL
jgi:hypothetical protein